MKKLFYLLIILLLSSCSKNGELHLKIIDKSSTIVAFGDSLTYGMGANLHEAYPAQLQKIIGVSTINEGVNGNTTVDAIVRLPNILEEKKPSLVIIGLGGNDMLRNMSEEEMVSNIKRMIQMIRAKNAQVVLLAIPKPSLLANIGMLSDSKVYEKISLETKTPLISNVYSELLSKKEYKSDMIHLNAKGYKKVAENIAEKLHDFGAIR